MHTLFISDLHLSSERPDKIVLFKKLLDGPARKADALYILGDLFESWAGDDDDTPPHPEIISTLANYTGAGNKLYVMRGNRDYLLGDEFAHKTGAETLPDSIVTNLYGTETLLMHGDTLCTRDVKYQVFRRLFNNRISIKFFMRFPFGIRQKIWHGVRNITRKTTARKSPYIVDVYQPEVDKVMQANKVSVMIHGHTHHEAIHEFELQGSLARRYVLGDWYDKDSVLVADKNRLQLMRVEEYLKGDW